MRIRILAVVVATICTALVVIWLYIKPSGTNSLGNRLSEYFYFTNTNAVTDQKLIKEQKRNNRNKKPELRAFYQTLPWVRQNNLINYQSEARSAWHQIDENGQVKANYLNYWQTIRPLSRSIYEKSINFVDVYDPVVHFRCSDAPFIKHGHYHLTKKHSVKWMAEQIKERGYNKVIMLTCNSHLSQDQDSCAKYVSFYSQIFKDSGLDVEYQCNSIVKDFAMMVYSPLLVSLNSSSFSFMAGVSKDPKNYISCNMGVEQDGKYLLQTEADWILDPSAPLLHKDVEDYHLTEDVIRKL